MVKSTFVNSTLFYVNFSENQWENEPIFGNAEFFVVLYSRIKNNTQTTPRKSPDLRSFNDDVPLEHVSMCNQVLSVTANMSVAMEGKRQEVRCAFVSVG